MAGERIEGLSIGLDLDSTALERGLTGLRDKLKIVNSEMRANLSAFDRAEKSVEKYEAQINTLSRKVEVQESIVKSARNEYKKMVEQHGEGSAEADRAARAYNREVANLNNFRRNLENTRRDMEKFRDEQRFLESGWGRLQQSMNKVRDGLKGIGKSMTTTITAPLAALGGFSAKVSAEFSDLTGDIIAKTGASMKQAGQLGKTAGDIWAAGFGDSLQDVEDAIIAVKQNLQNIKPNQLEEVTKKALGLTKITGADLDESLRGVNSLMVNFGMSANDAFDYLVTGAQRGLNKSHELEDNIAEYGQLWAQAGFSAKDMFRILENGLKTGAYNFDKVNDFVKEFGVSLNDGRFQKNIGSFSKETQKLFDKYKAGKATTKDVFESAINDLKNMKNEQQKLTIASTVWSSLGEDNAMKVITSLNDTNHAYDNVKGAADKANKAMTSTPTAKLQAAWRDVQRDLRPVGELLMNLAAQILPKIGAAITAVMTPFAKMNRTMQLITLGIAGFIGAIGPLLVIVGTVAGSISKIIELLRGLQLAMGATSIAGGILSGVMAVLTSPITIIIGAIAALGTAFVIAYNKITPFRNFINGIGAAIMRALNWIKQFSTAIIAMFKGDWYGGADLLSKLGLSDAAVQKIIIAVTFVKNIFRTLKNDIISALSAVANWWKGIWPQLSKVLSVSFKAMSIATAVILLPMFAVIRSSLGALRNSWKNIWGAMKSVVSIFYNALKTIVKVQWHAVSGIITVGLDILTGKWGKAWRDLKKTALNIFGDLKTGLKKIGGGIASLFANIAKGIANGLLGGIAGGVNGISSGINWILKRVHAPKKMRLGTWRPPRYANGTDNHKQDGPAIVGDGGQPELIALPNGKAFLSPDTDTLVNLPKGTSVLSGPDTAKLLSFVPKYAKGTGWMQNLWNSTKSTAHRIGTSILDAGKTICDYATNPSKLLSKVMSHFVDLSAIAEPALSMVKGTVNMVKTGAVNWIKSLLFTDNTDNPSGSGVERWRPYVVKALEMNGLSTSKDMVEKVLRQIKTESGGNPKAVQHGFTDINTITGDLAKGLMQTISATFNAYKFKGHGNIFNGFDNLLAALNYAKHRYGKNLSGLGEGHGYKTGGLINAPGLYSLVEDGWPEFVIPTNPSRRTEAMKLLALAGRKINASGSNRRPGQLPDVAGESSGVINRLDKQIAMMQQQIDLLTKILLKSNVLRIDADALEKSVSSRQAKNYNNAAYMMG